MSVEDHVHARDDPKALLQLQNIELRNHTAERSGNSEQPLKLIVVVEENVPCGELRCESMINLDALLEMRGHGSS